MEPGGPIRIILGIFLLNCVSSAYIPQPQATETNYEWSTTVGSFSHAITTTGTPSLASDGTLATTYEATTASPVLSSSTKGILAAATSGTTTLLIPNSADKQITTAGTSTISSITGRTTVTFNTTTEVPSIMDSWVKEVANVGKQSYKRPPVKSGRAKHYPQRTKFLLGSIPVLSGYKENVWV
ncbi:unnamed protein product [Orchesella dallaii]|uniref:Uncharacterized protein n=1 Tax=Orchesella dallaii TaxID=48710 RepID=A0ABP1R9M8_9HEXA